VILDERGIEHHPRHAPTLAASLSTILIQRAVFNSSEDVQSVLAQYSIMVQSWESLINRRQGVNQLYLSAVAALTTAIGALIGLSTNLEGQNIALASMILTSLGALLCWNWWRTISSYGTLSQAKSKVISAMEQVLPVRLFDAEWKVLQRKLYKSTTETDKRTIAVFLCLFAAVFLISLSFIAGLWH
jgi:hypothetical protein